LAFLNIFRAACDVTVFPGVYLGYLSQYLWYAAMFSSHAIACNRFVAISFPIAYRNIFTNKITFCLVGIVWIVAFPEDIWYFFGEETRKKFIFQAVTYSSIHFLMVGVTRRTIAQQHWVCIAV
jgi:hypothetical protein